MKTRQISSVTVGSQNSTPASPGEVFRSGNIRVNCGYYIGLRSPSFDTAVREILEISPTLGLQSLQQKSIIRLLVYKPKEYHALEKASHPTIFEQKIGTMTRNSARLASICNTREISADAYLKTTWRIKWSPTLILQVHYRRPSRSFSVLYRLPSLPSKIFRTARNRDITQRES
jgi:hypothetical protein